MITLNIIVFGGQRNIIEKIFPNKEQNISQEKREIRYFRDSIIFWKALIYPELNEGNYKEIKNEIKEYFNKEEKEREQKNIIQKNVILFFGNYGLKKVINFIFKEVEQTKRPLFLIISNIMETFPKLPDNRYLTFLNQNKEKIYEKIISYLWEKDCYFNERGNSTCKLSNANLFYKKPKGFTFLKILLIGLKRAGKSTLINIISKKLTALELPNDQSVTKKISEYEVYPYENKEEYNISSIKFYDSPGIEKNANLNSEEIVIDFLEKKFNEINLIYFLKRGGAIEDCNNVFKKIVKLNKEREKNKLKKIPIIFLINGDINIEGEKSSVAINSMKDYLIKNFGTDLYDENKNQKNDNDTDSDDDESNDKQYEDGNIIKVNLRKQKDAHSSQEIYGIDKIFAKSLEYLKLTNSLKNNDLDELKRINKQLINLFKQSKLGLPWDKKNKESLIKESKKITSRMMKENSLLKATPLLKDYVDKSISIPLIIAGAIGSIFLIGIPILISGIVIFSIGPIMQIALESGFEENDIENYELKQFFNNFKEEMSEAKKFFEEILKFTNGCQLFIKSFEIYQNILKSLDKLKNTDNEEWNKFTENEII